MLEKILPGGYLLKLDPTMLPEDSVFSSPEGLKFEVPVRGERKDMDFSIPVKPRPMIMEPPKQ